MFRPEVDTDGNFSGRLIVTGETEGFSDTDGTTDNAIVVTIAHQLGDDGTERLETVTLSVGATTDEAAAKGDDVPAKDYDFGDNVTVLFYANELFTGDIGADATLTSSFALDDELLVFIDQDTGRIIINGVVTADHAVTFTLDPDGAGASVATPLTQVITFNVDEDTKPDAVLLDAGLQENLSYDTTDSRWENSANAAVEVTDLDISSYFSQIADGHTVTGYRITAAGAQVQSGDEGTVDNNPRDNVLTLTHARANGDAAALMVTVSEMGMLSFTGATDDGFSEHALLTFTVSAEGSFRDGEQVSRVFALRIENVDVDLTKTGYTQPSVVEVNGGTTPAGANNNIDLTDAFNEGAADEAADPLKYEIVGISPAAASEAMATPAVLTTLGDDGTTMVPIATARASIAGLTATVDENGRLKFSGNASNNKLNGDPGADGDPDVYYKLVVRVSDGGVAKGVGGADITTDTDDAVFVTVTIKVDLQDITRPTFDNTAGGDTAKTLPLVGDDNLPAVVVDGAESTASTFGTTLTLNDYFSGGTQASYVYQVSYLSSLGGVNNARLNIQSGNLLVLSKSATGSGVGADSTVTATLDVIDSSATTIIATQQTILFTIDQDSIVTKAADGATVTVTRSGAETTPAIASGGIDLKQNEGQGLDYTIDLTDLFVEAATDGDPLTYSLAVGSTVTRTDSTVEADNEVQRTEAQLGFARGAAGIRLDGTNLIISGTAGNVHTDHVVTFTITASDGDTGTAPTQLVRYTIADIDTAIADARNATAIPTASLVEGAAASTLTSQTITLSDFFDAEGAPDSDTIAYTLKTTAAQMGLTASLTGDKLSFTGTAGGVDDGDTNGVGNANDSAEVLVTVVADDDDTKVNLVFTITLTDIDEAVVLTTAGNANSKTTSAGAIAVGSAPAASAITAATVRGWFQDGGTDGDTIEYGLGTGSNTVGLMLGVNAMTGELTWSGTAAAANDATLNFFVTASDGTETTSGTVPNSYNHRRCRL